jgi:hypothetical protein
MKVSGAGRILEESGKVKLSLYLINWAPHGEKIWESAGIALKFLTSASGRDE